MTEAYITGMGIALGKEWSTERFIEVDAEMRRRHGQPATVREQIRRFAENSRIEMRHTVNQGWLPESQRDPGAEDIFGPYDFDPPAWLRARYWHQQAPLLAGRAARAALEDWGGPPEDISHVITTCTTGWSEPGLAVSLIDQLGLSEDTRKIELNFNGCFCGMSCLRTARDIVRGGESGAVLVMAMELSTMQYDVTDTDPGSMVSMVLFSDGAGAMIVAPEGRWHFRRAGMSLVPDSRDMLRFNPNHERESQAYKMYLSPHVGKRLAAYLRDGRGKRLLDDLNSSDSGAGLPALAVHPGGPNILESIEAVLVDRGFGRDVLADSFATLRGTGNLGAAAILFVLYRVLTATGSERVCSLAFGPGVTVEWGEFLRVSS